MSNPEPDRDITSVLVRSQATCTLLAASYHRVITNVKVLNAVEGEVFVYVGSLDNTPIARHFVGSNNTLKGEIDLPPGYNFYVVWTNAPTVLSQARITVSSMRLDPDEKGSTTALTWEPVERQRSLLAPDLQVSSGPQTVNGGATFNLPIQDMRAYQSFSVNIDITTIAAGTGWNPIGIAVVWLQNGSGAPNPVVYEDIYWIFANNNGSGGFPNQNGRFLLQDTVHGPFLRVVIFHNGVDNATVNMSIYGNSRSIARRYVGNHPNVGGVSSTALDDFDSVLYSNGFFVNAGAFVDGGIIRMAPGPATIKFIAGSASPLTFSMYSPSGNQFLSENLLAGGSLLIPYTLPRMATLLKIFNSGGVNNNFLALITTGRDNW